MKKNKTHQEFLKLLQQQNIYYKENKFKIVDVYKCNSCKILIKNRYGCCLIYPHSLLKNSKPSIKSAVDKTQYWINKAIEVHGDRYDYSLVEYTYATSNTQIICKKHGIFEQKSCSHLLGHGCEKCSIEYRANNRTKTLEKFILESNMVHKGIYSYNDVIYKGDSKKISITCPIHGNFEQVPSNHLQGSGCPKCNNLTSGWSKSDWKIQGENSNYFDSFKVYVIKCWNGVEKFYKIGRTFTTIQRRFAAERDLPYQYSILYIYEGTSEEIYDLENKLQGENKNHLYIPKLKFNGMYECFSKIN